MTPNKENVEKHDVLSIDQSDQFYYIANCYIT